MSRRRTLVPVAVVAVLVMAVVAVEVTGQISGRSVFGRAAGLGDQGSGCAQESAVVPPEQVPDVIVAASVDRIPAHARDHRPGPTDLTRWEIEGQFVVRVKNHVKPVFEGWVLAHSGEHLDALLAQRGAKSKRAIRTNSKAPLEERWNRTLIVQQGAGQGDSRALLDELLASPDVEFAEPLVRLEALGTPNDPYYFYQWHLSSLGAPSAWDTTRGEGVVVAVVDTGVSTNEDGLFDLLAGNDFIDEDDDPTDLNGHGTHVAGTIAQLTDNGLGAAGLAPGASILPVRVLDADGVGDNAQVAAGIMWAADQGAQVINLSLGGPIPSIVLEDAVRYATEQGALVVAATGNDGYTASVGYPAAYEDCIAVGATDLAGEFTYYSNRGDEIDLTAPGGDLTVDLDDDGLVDGVLQETFVEGEWNYWLFQGTSMATPHVAAAAALLFGAGIDDAEDVRATLLANADDRGPEGWDPDYGHGIVNPVLSLANGVPIDDPEDADGSPPSSGTPPEDDNGGGTTPPEPEPDGSTTDPGAGAPTPPDAADEEATDGLSTGGSGCMGY